LLDSFRFSVLFVVAAKEINVFVILFCGRGSRSLFRPSSLGFEGRDIVCGRFFAVSCEDWVFGFVGGDVVVPPVCVWVGFL